MMVRGCPGNCWWYRLRRFAKPDELAVPASDAPLRSWGPSESLQSLVPVTDRSFEAGFL